MDKVFELKWLFFFFCQQSGCFITLSTDLKYRLCLQLNPYGNLSYIGKKNRRVMYDTHYSSQLTRLVNMADNNQINLRCYKFSKIVS